MRERHQLLVVGGAVGSDHSGCNFAGDSVDGVGRSWIRIWVVDKVGGTDSGCEESDTTASCVCGDGSIIGMVDGNGGVGSGPDSTASFSGCGDAGGSATVLSLQYPPCWRAYRRRLQIVRARGSPYKRYNACRGIGMDTDTMETRKSICRRS